MPEWNFREFSHEFSFMLWTFLASPGCRCWVCLPTVPLHLGPRFPSNRESCSPTFHQSLQGTGWEMLPSRDQDEEFRGGEKKNPKEQKYGEAKVIWGNDEMNVLTPGGCREVHEHFGLVWGAAAARGEMELSKTDFLIIFFLHQRECLRMETYSSTV